MPTQAPSDSSELARERIKDSTEVGNPTVVNSFTNVTPKSFMQESSGSLSVVVGAALSVVVGAALTRSILLLAIRSQTQRNLRVYNEQMLYCLSQHYFPADFVM